MPAPVSANDPARRRARASGAVKYEASYVCTADPEHGVIRYARNGMCCECAARARDRSRERQFLARQAGMPPDMKAAA